MKASSFSLQPSAFVIVRVNVFLDGVVASTRARLPPRWRRFRTRKRYTLVQLYFARRTIHYEVWIRGKERLLEVGLHCESDRETNAALLAHLSSCLFEIKEALGDQVEVEQWTSSWTRAHQLVPYEKLDDATIDVISQRLARMIEVLEPMLERAATPPKKQKVGAKP